MRLLDKVIPDQNLILSDSTISGLVYNKSILILPNWQPTCGFSLNSTARDIKVDFGSSMSMLIKKQLNQKLKLMVDGLGIGLYSSTPPHANALWAWSVAAAKALPTLWIHQYGTCWNSNSRPLTQKGSDTMFKNQLKAPIPYSRTNSTKSLNWWLKA